MLLLLLLVVVKHRWHDFNTLHGILPDVFHLLLFYFVTGRGVPT
jgi:hypothetical protein